VKFTPDRLPWVFTAPHHSTKEAPAAGLGNPWTVITKLQGIAGSDHEDRDHGVMARTEIPDYPSQGRC
jgi:hypothetical protein